MSYLFIYAISTLSSAIVYFIGRLLLKRRVQPVVAFFHPHTNDGGGGEKVLWCAVRCVQERLPMVRCAIYTVDPATSESLMERSMVKFGIQLTAPVEVIHLSSGNWIDAGTYPRLTLLLQSLGSIVLAWEAITKLNPIVFIDTCGYAFTYPVAFLHGCTVACYTHYPTISSDMMLRVSSRAVMYNNDSSISGSSVMSGAKVVYYRIMTWLYGLVGQFASVVMVNSSWTQNHILKLWRIPGRTFLVYPPCDTSSLQKLPLERPANENPYFVSVAQFRPEKAHTLQLLAFKEFVESSRLDPSLRHMRLKMVGSCRHVQDESRIEVLSALAVSLGIESRIDFCINVSHSELHSILGGALAGLHTMVDEHFGISVVEYMAAGAIPIAHNSGGPKEDIVVADEEGRQVGFLAKTVDEYASAMYRVASMSPLERLEISEAGRKHVQKFSEHCFSSAFEEAMHPIFESLGKRLHKIPAVRVKSD